MDNQQFIEIGSRIQTRRKALNLNQSDLAELLEISNNHMSSIENGKHSTKLKTFIKLCNCLKTTPNHLWLGCMYPNNVPKNIIDTLSMCDEEQIQLISDFTEFIYHRKLSKK